MPAPPRRIAAAGFSHSDLLIVVAVISFLLALLLPALQQVREAARRFDCSNNLAQIGRAIRQYESAHGMFPPGASGGASLHVCLLPYVGQADLYDRLDDTSSNPQAPLSSIGVSLYLCPSDRAPNQVTSADGLRKAAATNYAGNSGSGVQTYGFNGLFQHTNSTFPKRHPEGPVRVDDVIDGLANTAAVSEILHNDKSRGRLRMLWNTPRALTGPNELDAFADVCARIPPNPSEYGWQGAPNRGLPWTRGDVGYTMYNHVLTPNQPSCINGMNFQLGAYTAAAMHSGGVNVLYADGHVGLENAFMSRSIWRDIGSRNGSAQKPQDQP